MIKVYLNKIFINLPKNQISNEFLSKVFNSWDPEKISAKTGISNRYIAAENETALDLSIKPSKDALNYLSRMNKSIDYLIYVSQSNDYIFPGNASILLSKLNRLNLIRLTIR